MFNRYHNSLTLGKMGVSEAYHLSSDTAALTFTDNSLSGIMNLKSHYNLAGGRDTKINPPPRLIGTGYNYLNSYYFDSTDRASWNGWPGTNYVPLFNDFFPAIYTPLQQGDVLILIMFSARGNLHVTQANNVFTKNRLATWNNFGAFTVASSTSLSAHWIRIPQNATNAQLLDEYPYITRADVVADAIMGSSTSVQNVTDGTIYLLRGVPTSRSPFLNTSVTGSWIDADTNEIAQKTTLQDFGKSDTLYLNYVYTPILTTGTVPDSYPDTYGSIYSNDLYFSGTTIDGNISSDNFQYETFSTSWFNDNNPRMYSTSPIYNNKLQKYKFSNRTFPAITGYFDSTGGILIEIPY